MNLEHFAHHRLTRRDFIRSAGLVGAGLAAAALGATVRAFSPSGPTPVLDKFTYLPLLGSGARVAIVKAASYDRALVKQQLQAVLDGIGGLGKVLAHGNRVAVKVNLTGGVSSHVNGFPPDVETYITHPEVVRALLELLHDAGATDVAIVEAAYEDASWDYYGYREIIGATNSRIVDLTPDPVSGFITIPSSSNPIYYDQFTVNPLLANVDAFISISKMKCHQTAGVTHTLKNLFGLVPYRFYALNPNDHWRSAFHNTDPGTHVPGTIIDLNQARPIHLSIVDGIKSAEGGEGPWIGSQFKPKAAGLLIAGLNPVATDAVASACMGFDPQADYPAAPFVNGINHLALASQHGLGSNDLSRIEVVGEKIADVVVQFTPSY